MAFSVDEELYNPTDLDHKLLEQRELEENEQYEKELALQRKLDESVRKQNELEENLKNLKILKRQKDEENEQLQVQLQELIAKKDELDRKKAKSEAEAVAADKEESKKQQESLLSVEIKLLKEKIEFLEKERQSEVKSNLLLEKYINKKEEQLKETLRRVANLEEDVKTLSFFKESYKREIANLVKEKNMLESMLLTLSNENQLDYNYNTCNQITKVENPYFKLDSLIATTSSTTNKVK